MIYLEPRGARSKPRYSKSLEGLLSPPVSTHRSHIEDCEDWRGDAWKMSYIPAGWGMTWASDAIKPFSTFAWSLLSTNLIRFLAPHLNAASRGSVYQGLQVSRSSFLFCGFVRVRLEKEIITLPLSSKTLSPFPP